MSWKIGHLPVLIHSISITSGVYHREFQRNDDCLGSTCFGLVQITSNRSETVIRTAPLNTHLSSLFPLDGSRRFTGDIVGYPINSLDLIDNTRGHASEKIVRKREKIGCHAVRGRYGPQSAGIIVGT